MPGQPSHGIEATIRGSFTEPVCVVITDLEMGEDMVRSLLGDSLPLRVVSWEGQKYLAAITSLRPRVIVVLDSDGELLQQRAQLIASLFSSYPPTVISATLAESPLAAPRLLLHELGAGTVVRITAVSDVLLQ